MGLSNIRPRGPSQNSDSKGVGKSFNNIQLMISGQLVIVSPSRIQDAASKVAKLAYDLGQTNDQEEFTNEVAEDIEEALKIVAKRKNKKKKKRD